MDEALFRSFFIGGFECSTHLLHEGGRRLNMISATGHDRHIVADYARLLTVAIRTARDGILWPQIEQTPGRYDFSTALPMVRAARDVGIQVVWDLLHFGWPDHIDVFSATFIDRFRKFAQAFGRVLRSETDEAPYIAPVNEISFLSFAGGEVGFFNPFARGRGDELKNQLVRAAVAASEALLEINPRTRLVHTDPIINVIHDPACPQERPAAEGHRAAQYHSWDMIAGRRHPELGGAERYLDILGVNYYVHNQWVYPGGHGSMILPSDRRYRPLQEMLLEVHARYARPMFIAETGIEDAVRPCWLRYMGREVRMAIRAGVPLRGVCLYPIVNHPGWNDDRHCYNGLWDYADERGERAIYEPLAKELARQYSLFEQLQAGEFPQEKEDELDLRELDETARSVAEATEESRER